MSNDSEQKLGDPQLDDLFSKTQTEQDIFGAKHRVTRSPPLSKPAHKKEETKTESIILDNVTKRRPKIDSKIADKLYQFPIKTQKVEEKTDKTDQNIASGNIDLKSQINNSKNQSKESAFKSADESHHTQNPSSSGSELDLSEYEHCFRINYRVISGGQVIKKRALKVPLIDPNADLHLLFEAAFRNFTETIQIPEQINFETDSLENWTVSDMAEMTIKEVTDLIPIYRGEENSLNGFIKNIDRLWAHITGYADADRARFMLVLQLRLTEKAAEATKNADFESWNEVKIALKANINPQNNIEKAELKLAAIRQVVNEEVERYAGRVEELLDNCNVCKNRSHNTEDCRRRDTPRPRSQFNVEGNDKREVTCYRCGKNGHYANVCNATPMMNQPNNQDRRRSDQNNPNNNINQRNMRTPNNPQARNVRLYDNEPTEEYPIEDVLVFLDQEEPISKN